MTKVLLCAVVLAACASSASQSPAGAGTTPSGTASLYDRLGGKPAITAVVDDFIGNVAADKRINDKFAKTDIPHLKMELVDQICAATGGPCKYTGRDMRDVHSGMNVTDAQFDALVGDLKASLDKFKVGDREQGELLGALGKMRGDIVGH